MTTAPASAIETRPPRRRGWGQFSLVSLLLLAVIGCLVGAYIAEVRRRQAAEDVIRQKDAEVRQNRIDLGLLDDQPIVLNITDPTKVYVRQLPTHDPITNWRWKIYLPPKTRWRVAMDQGETLEIVRSGKKLFGSGMDLRESGQFILEGRLERDFDGATHLHFRCGTQGTRSLMPAAGANVLRANGSRMLYSAGGNGQDEFAQGEKVELFRHFVRIEEGQPLPEGTTLYGHREPSREYGFVIYLQQEVAYRRNEETSPKVPQ